MSHCQCRALAHCKRVCTCRPLYKTAPFSVTKFLVHKQTLNGRLGVKKTRTLADKAGDKRVLSATVLIFSALSLPFSTYQLAQRHISFDQTLLFGKNISYRYYTPGDSKQCAHLGAQTGIFCNKSFPTDTSHIGFLT